MSRYQISGHLPMPQRQPGALGVLGNWAMNKGANAALNAALPGGGLAAEAAQVAMPHLIPRFNEGGKLDAAKWMYGEYLPGLAKEGAQSVWEGFKGAIPTREDLALDPASLALAKKYWTESVPSGKFYNHGGMVHPDEKQYQMDHKNHLMGVTEYKKAGGRVGPLAKTVMKGAGGETSERHYHNPLQAKSSSDK